MEADNLAEVPKKLKPWEIPPLTLRRDELPETLNFNQVAGLLGYTSRRGLDHLLEITLDFPQPFRRIAHFGRTTAPMIWRTADVLRWLDTQAKQAQKQPPRVRPRTAALAVARGIRNLGRSLGLNFTPRD
jgi:hypothetical protein